MRNSNNQQYDYQKVHQVTPEELQKTLVSWLWRNS